MRKLSILTPFFLFFLLLCYTSVATSTPRYIAVDDITLNCGASGNLTARDERLWIGDINSKSPPIEEPNHKSTASTAEQRDTIDTVPYQTARISFSQFTYEFSVTPGPKFLRLYFFNASYQGFNNSIGFFTVKAGSFILLSNFSAALASSSNQGAIYKEFCVNVGDEKKLNVTFIPCPSNSSKFYAFINGIEIISMPNNLYYRPEGTEPSYVRLLSPLSISYNKALEMVNRLNVGGGDISPEGDTGMFRKWSQDNGYFFGDSVIPHVITMRPRYTKEPNYTAPDDVYQTARSMGPHGLKNLDSNLTWRLHVDSGFNYLVRLHFCEVEADIIKVGMRPFIIYINNKTAEAHADVILWSGRNETPVYKDYVVRIQGKELFVALHPIMPEFGIIDAFLNGMEVFKLSDIHGNLAVAGPNPEKLLSPLPPQQSASAANQSKTKKLIIFATGSVAGISVLLILACCMVLWKLRKTKRQETEKGKPSRTRATSLPGEICRHFTLEEIKLATDNFKEELLVGTGGFGKVYRGLINEGTMTVAIKRLNPESKQGFREFRTEIEMLSQLRHIHLVSLIGYCNDEGEMILIYDFMPNGTLRHHLYDTHNNPLSWKQRLRICGGAARGLDYLHTGVEQPIIHRDVKTTNILLDEKWEAKVSDFGLSKTGLEHGAVSTLVKGTFGYLDPDYARRRQLTAKSDVYSFGVVLLEVLCGRKALDQKLETSQWNLANWARECIDRGTIGEIIDPHLKGKIAPQCFKVYVEVAESCVREQGIRRPTMNDVKQKLEFALELQECADAEMEKINAGGQYSYPEVLSFPVSGTIGVFRNNNAGSDLGLETDSGTRLGTTSTGLTSSTLDYSDAIVAQDDFTDITNSKA